MKRGESVRGHGDERAGCELLEAGEQFGHQGRGVFVAIGAGSQHHNGERDDAQVL